MDLTLRIALRKWCELLQQHSGRDKVVRVTGYICTLISDFPVICLLFDFPFTPFNWICVVGSSRWTFGTEVPNHWQAIELNAINNATV